ncbi:DUF3991 and toprim domain-containing protein [Pseudoflavonifractor phocaeensis]|uniref:DUF3991 and toprim domain-containing protein n=1 Tax=Pseudoflavonifractor phocaeensis TaxID=1870988 RepID=UPI00210A5E4B|nr:DUF3991 domain-containing protein [Pseudoflavonifractor phocaeensis]MCQ4863527.1 DUF3991 domain-containing protein [Pseudoflavonifractor phocaeensis]
MTRYIPFTDEQKLRAGSVDLARFLELRGEELERSGREMRMKRDHSVTIRGSRWYDHAAREGGNAISFVRRFYGLSYPEAVSLLLDGEGGHGYPAAEPKAQEPPKPFVLPPAHTDMRRVFAYLVKARRIHPEVVRAFARAGLLYEDVPYHNAVFVGLDEHGVARHAHKRSTNAFGKAFRLNVEGSRPQYSFHHVGEGDRLIVTEAPIDMLSYISLNPENWRRQSYVSLCGVGGQALHWMLERHPHIRNVALALDHDEAGLAASARHRQALEAGGYQTELLLPRRKDWNEDLAQGPPDAPEPAMRMEPV